MFTNNSLKFVTLAAALLLAAGSGTVFAQSAAGKSTGGVKGKVNFDYVVEGINQEWVRNATPMTAQPGEHNAKIHQIEGANQGSGQGAGYALPAGPQHDLKTHQVEGPDKR